MKKNVTVKTLACSLSAVLGLGFLAGCGGGKIEANTDALVIMTEELNELYNPFYSTAGTDMDVVGNTQISMLSTDKDGKIAVGNGEPTLVLAYQKEEKQGHASIDDSIGLEDHYTEYTFILKNGLKFSNGSPVTINDVMFNLYVYLDPTYTGSTTMYSTKIIGLQTYRTQSQSSEEGAESQTTTTANNYATSRLNELVTVFHSDEFRRGTGSDATYRATEEQMRNMISGSTYYISDGYKTAIGKTDDASARAQLLQDYNDAIAYFREELENDYKSSKEAFTEEPYKSAPVFYQGNQVATGFDEITSFMYNEGFVDIKHPQQEGQAEDKEQIERAELQYDPSSCDTKEKAIEYAYQSNVYTKFDQILYYWSTGTRLHSEFAAKAKDILLHSGLQEGELRYKSIDGIQSLGHVEGAPSTITIDGTPYKIASYKDGGYNEDGSVKNPNEYAALRITIDGTDPKAIWNFAFTVAPHYYYSDPDGLSDEYKQHNQNASDAEKWDLKVDIANEKYGVSWADFDFHKDIIQGTYTYPGTNIKVSKNKVPAGAGPYMASDSSDSRTPTAEGFYSEQKVFYIANPNFSLDGKTMTPPKIERMRYQVISSTNALGVLEDGTVHYVSPQFTKENFEKIEELKDRGVAEVDTWQLGYGYIGVNAAYIKQLGLRKAIMSAMQTSLALEYYYPGTAENIAWPMSAVSWAHPRTGNNKYDGANPTANMDKNNGHDYMMWTNEEAAKEKIRFYYQEAVNELNGGTPDTEIVFTIAGSNMYEHPAYAVFKKAMDLLNECGWSVTLKPDASALTKLSTGSLEVWAAAWGSTIDPDMYQVYHKDSTATSVLAWGYNSIRNLADTEYETERTILNNLSRYIDDARKIDDETTRAGLYKTAMGYVLDLAVEMPLYQRKTMYAYNANAINVDTLPQVINSYTSPLSRIWEVDFNR